MRRNKIVTFALAACSILIGACGQTTTSTSYTPPTPGGGSTQVQAGSTTCDLVNNRFSGGDGSALNPYQISDLCDMVNFLVGSDTWGSNFIMKSDIDLAGVTVNYSVAFTGTFDGAGHSINNYAGSSSLIAYNSGTFKNLSLKNVAVDLAGLSRGGGLVSTNDTSGRISHVAVTGTLINGLYFVGGIAGVNNGQIINSTAAITATAQATIGGLVGQNQGSLLASSASGTVSAGSSGAQFGAGGLAGTNTATVSNCYATTAVSGVSRIGGLVGDNSGTIANSFSAGPVVGTGSDIGGLNGFNEAPAGGNPGGTVSNSYWDQQASGLSASAGGSGKTSAQMFTQATFAGWDFTSTWFPPSGGYPTLR